MRSEAIKWWKSINGTVKQKELGDTFCKTRPFSAKEIPLTGREIEQIWNREVNGECTKCRQTVQNCECHIPIEEKHKGLFQMHSLIKKLNLNN